MIIRPNPIKDNKYPLSKCPDCIFISHEDGWDVYYCDTQVRGRMPYVMTGKRFWIYNPDRGWLQSGYKYIEKDYLPNIDSIIQHSNSEHTALLKGAKKYFENHLTIHNL